MELRNISDRIVCPDCGLKHIHKNDIANHIKSKRHVRNSQSIPTTLGDAGNSKNRMDCPECGVKKIHKNDIKNHTESRKHLRNVQNVTKDHLDTELKVFRCIDCNKNYKDANSFKGHLASISHKKNVDNLNKETKPTEDKINHKFRALRISDEVISMMKDNELFKRQKYKVRSDSKAFRDIQTYICSLVSYLSVKLAVDTRVKDFNISVNNKKYQQFGDVVIELKRFDEKIIIYAVKCKNVSLKSQKQIDSLKEGKIHLIKEYDNIKSLRDLNEFSSIKFILFTTSSTSSKFQKYVDFIWDENLSIKLNISSSTRHDIIDVSNETDSVFSIHSENENKNLPPLFLYTNQRFYLRGIDDLIKNIFTKQPTIYKSYNDYIVKWCIGKLGGNYLLTKEDAILKIGEIVLEPFIILPKVINMKNKHFGYWNVVVQKVDVIILKSEPFILSKVCEPFNKLIESELVKIDLVTNSVTITDEIIENIKNLQIKAYLFEEVQDFKTEIDLPKIYRVFWKAGKIPLLISLENNEDSMHFILEVISFMKELGKKFMIKSAQDFYLVRNAPANLTIFACLHDIRQYINLDEIKIKVGKHDQLSLTQIIENDPFFLKWITPNMFFDMALNRYSIQKDEKWEFDNECDLKIILDDNLKDWIQKKLYGCPRQENLGRLKGIDPNFF